MVKSISFGIGVGSLLFTLAGTGCSPSGISDFEFSNTRQANEVDNGIDFNGMKQNGMKQNGMKQNGMKQNGIELHITEIIDGVISAAADADQALTFNSSQLSGTIVEAELENGSIAKYRIESSTYNESLGTSLYFLSNLDPATGVWSSACGIDPTGTYAPINTEIPAVAFADTWNLVNGENVSDPTKFTFSCVNAAIGKCLVWGYKRWASQDECLSPGNCKSRDLSFFHQACTRMVRADYCGTGAYHTRNGTSIDVFDSLDIQSPANLDGWSLEAEWRYDGAHCINHTRWGKADQTQNPNYQTDLAYIEATCPDRLSSHDARCADSSKSNFFTANGFASELADRVVLRNRSYQHN